MCINGNAGAATIIRVSKSFLPIKLISYLGKLESSQAELWSAILAFAMLKSLKYSEQITWISDSQTTLNYFSKKLALKNSPKHLEEWRLLDQLTSELIVCCQHRSGSSKHKDLLACDRASRWAANLAEQINTKQVMIGKNIIKDPRYAWQVVNLIDPGSNKIEAEKLEFSQLLSEIKVYRHA